MKAQKGGRRAAITAEGAGPRSLPRAVSEPRSYARGGRPAVPVTRRRVCIRARWGLLTALAAATCSSPYLTNRVRDAADIATVSFGYGVGARARVSAIGTGVFANRDLGGLRGGHFDPWWGDENGSFLTDVDLLIYRMEVFPAPGEAPDRRHKGFMAVGVGPWTRAGEFELFRQSSRTPHFYTQIEVAAGLGPSLRVGFNPGELLDFLFGLSGADLFGDDIEDDDEHDPAVHQS
ncbi:MAG: hypothetical protein MUE60_14135 [Candidatus Eisenbacteria bacterium]|nr:hypothetical protein [Candidatus Eisenbacteria bacterium]